MFLSFDSAKVATFLELAKCLADFNILEFGFFF